MVKQGPIPAFVHGVYEYVLGGVLIALPLALSYKSGAATAVSVILGVLVIFLTATTTWSTSLVKQVPLAAHVLLDYVLVVLLIASPFLFSFSSETKPTAVFITVGVLHLLVSIGTRYRKEDAVERGTPEAKLEPPGADRSAGASRADRRAVRDDEIPEFEPPPRPQ
jgi:hypothetical protein